MSSVAGLANLWGTAVLLPAIALLFPTVGILFPDERLPGPRLARADRGRRHRARRRDRAPDDRTVAPRGRLHAPEPARDRRPAGRAVRGRWRPRDPGNLPAVRDCRGCGGRAPPTIDRGRARAAEVAGGIRRRDRHRISVVVRDELRTRRADRPAERGDRRMVPIAVGIAILRYHLYEIDRIVSRTIAYVLITTLPGRRLRRGRSSCCRGRSGCSPAATRWPSRCPP